jgi:hypothetical protein
MENFYPIETICEEKNYKIKYKNEHLEPYHNAIIDVLFSINLYQTGKEIQ